MPSVYKVKPAVLHGLGVCCWLQLWEVGYWPQGRKQAEGLYNGTCLYRRVSSLVSPRLPQNCLFAAFYQRPIKSTFEIKLIFNIFLLCTVQ